MDELYSALATYRRTGFAMARDYVIECASRVGLTLQEALSLPAHVPACAHKGTPQRIYPDGTRRCTRCGIRH